MKLRKRSSAWWGARAGAPPNYVSPVATFALLLYPPLLDVVERAIRRWIEVLKGLLRDGQRVVDVAEVVRLVLVQDLVDCLVLRLARRRRAVSVSRVAPLLYGLVQGGVFETGEAEAFGLLGRVRDVVGVPANIRVRVAAEAPTDDRRLECLIAGRELGHETLECFRARLRVDTQLLVLIRSDLGQRLALLITGVRGNRDAELLSV